MSGLKAAIDAAGGTDAVRDAAEARRREAEGHQLALLAEENDALDAALPIAPPIKRGPGRPAGARNKRTEANAAYLLGRYGDPLEGLLALGSGDLAHTHREMVAAARETGLPLTRSDAPLTVLDLMRFKQACLEAVLPYLHAKRAPENDKGEAVVPVLAFGTVAPGAQAAIEAAAGGALSILDLVAVEDPRGERFQALSEDAPDGSHDRGSGDGS